MDSSATDAASNACLLIGGGLLAGESEYLSEDLSTGIPMIHLNYGGFFWETTEIGFFLLGGVQENLYWGMAALLELPPNGFEAKGEAHLAGLDDRDATLEAGLMLAGGGNWGDVEIEINVDVENEHEGSEVSAGYSFPLNFGNFTVAPGVTMRLRDEKNSNYYYGVKDSEANDTGRPAYKVDEATLSIGFGYSMEYVLGSKWMLFHSLDVISLDDAIADSPLTVNDESELLSFGVAYRVF